jgi:hypothetical protein
MTTTTIARCVELADELRRGSAQGGDGRAKRGATTRDAATVLEVRRCDLNLERDATRARSGEDGARGAKDDLTDDAVSRNGDDDARR